MYVLEKPVEISGGKIYIPEKTIRDIRVGKYILGKTFRDIGGGGDTKTIIQQFFFF